MIKTTLKRHIKNLLPVHAVAPIKNLNGAEANYFVTYSLKRSGQHAVINWLCSQIQDILHFNHCNFERINLSNWITPINNRITQYKNDSKVDSNIQAYPDMVNALSKSDYFDNLLYSFEDIDLENKILRKFIYNNEPTVIIILRDPYNWLASTLKRKDCDYQQLVTKVNMLTKYLEQALGLKKYITHPVYTINYNEWVANKQYRVDICHSMSINFSESADDSILEIPDFGGGSSFEGESASINRNTSLVFQRWKDYTSDPDFRNLLDNPYLVDLSKSYFGFDRPF